MVESKTDKKPKPEKSKEKKVTQITSKKLTKRKKPLGSKIRDSFIGEESRNIGGYILMDVLIPALKGLVMDIVNNGLEMKFYGRRGDTRYSSRSRYGNKPSHVNYTSYSKQQDRREPISSRGRARHDFGEILFDSRAEAEDVIFHLADLLDDFDEATVADLYTLCGIDHTTQDRRWGWEDLSTAKSVRTRSGFILDLPRPIPLD